MFSFKNIELLGRCYNLLLFAEIFVFRRCSVKVYCVMFKYVSSMCGQTMWKNRRLKRTAVLMATRVVRGIISTFHTDSEVSSFINSHPSSVSFNLVLSPS